MRALKVAKKTKTIPAARDEGIMEKVKSFMSGMHRDKEPKKKLNKKGVIK